MYIVLYVGRDSHEYCGDVPHDRRHLLCGGPRLRETERLQLQDRHGPAHCHPNITGKAKKNNIVFRAMVLKTLGRVGCFFVCFFKN